MSVAKSRLFRRLQSGRLRYQGDYEGKILTLGDWAQEWLRLELKRPNLKPRTKQDTANYVKALAKAPVMSVLFARLNGNQCLDWWREGQ